MKKQLSRSIGDPSVWAILVTVGLFVFGSARPARADDDDGEKYLYIWAGHVDHSIPMAARVQRRQRRSAKGNRRQVVRSRANAAESDSL